MEWAYIVGGIAALVVILVVWKKIENLFSRGSDKNS